jgi:hypothetical protein
MTTEMFEMADAIKSELLKRWPSTDFTIAHHIGDSRGVVLIWDNDPADLGSVDAVVRLHFDYHVRRENPPFESLDKAGEPQITYRVAYET